MYFIISFWQNYVKINLNSLKVLEFGYHSIYFKALNYHVDCQHVYFAFRVDINLFHLSIN